MREIKFRAWDKAENIMLSDILVGTDDYTDLLNETIEYLQDKVVLMQYTGLKDKNGKEIYEGDIVEVVDHQYINECPEIAKFIGVIEYNNGSFCVRMDEIYSNYRLMDLEMKVIANIYENPELLEVDDNN